MKPVGHADTTVAEEYLGAAIAILIPTVNRADMLAALVENIHDVTEVEHRVYLIMENDDPESVAVAWDLDTHDVIGKYGYCSVAMNAGYRASTEPFVALVNDDTVFHRGWDTAALARFSDTAHIVGLNDGHGDTKSFIMVRRAYIEKESGVYDQPNTVFHTYKSQGPDTELAFYAMLRGVWADAPDAVVEHVNWRHGADPNHPNYLKAQDHVAEDLAEYERRRPHWDPLNMSPPAVPTVSPR